MEGPVEFKTTRGPGAEDSYKCGLYYVVFVEEIIILLLVFCIPYLSAESGKYTYFKKFIFKNEAADGEN